MSKTTYRIRKSLLIPLAIDTFFLFVLLVIVFFTDAHPAERVVLSVIFIPLAYSFLESIFRKTTVETKGIQIQKLLRRKALDWNDITNIDTIILRKKIYLILTTTKGFCTLSNSYGNFTNLTREIIEHIDSDKVEKSVRDIIKQPIHKIWDVVGTWLAAILLFFIIYMKLFVS